VSRCSLSNKQDAFVLVIESAASVRSMLMDVLHGLGFAHVQAASSGKDALHFLEVENVDWLLTPLMADDEVNALHILKLITVHPKLRSTNCSLLLDPANEDYCLTQAFELGLLSWHRKSYVKDECLNDLQELFALLEMNDWDQTLTAAEYLRGHLVEKSLPKSRLALEHNLLAMYPGTPRLLVSAAEAEFLNGNQVVGNSLLHQAELIDGELGPHCSRVRQKFPMDTKAELTRPENVLGLKSVVVIDPDTDVLHATGEMLRAIGVKKIECFENGAKAFEWLKAAPEPDLILMEWRVPGLTGPALIQRIRQSISQQVPVIVVSSLIKKDEKPLLREMGIDDVLEKPFDHTSFYAAAIWTIQQNRSPTEEKSLERKIRRLLATGKIGEAERLIAQFTSDPRFQPASKKEIEAEYEFLRCHYQRALALSAEALKTGGGDSLMLLNLAGKCMLKLKQHQGALRCFEKAKEISPMNIERLIDLAEVNLHLDRVKEAKAQIDAAAALDAQNPELGQARAQCALQVGDLKQAASVMEGLDSVSRVVAYINNRAVSLILSGRFEEGIGLYKRAIQALPASASEVKAAVTYNLALGEARHGEYEKAKEVLKSLKNGPQVGVFKKALALAKRLDLCIEKGLPLFADQNSAAGELSIEGDGHQQYSGAAAPAVESAVQWQEILAKIEAKRGDFGCHLVFMSVENPDPKGAKLLEKMPHFVARSTIGRTEVLAKPERNT